MLFNGTKVKTVDLPTGFALPVINSHYHDIEKLFAFTTYCPGIAFHGLADQLTVYNRVLTDTEVRGLFR